VSLVLEVGKNGHPDHSQKKKTSRQIPPLSRGTDFGEENEKVERIKARLKSESTSVDGCQIRSSNERIELENSQPLKMSANVKIAIKEMINLD
jgi:hypothetical protein